MAISSKNRVSPEIDKVRWEHLVEDEMNSGDESVKIYIRFYCIINIYNGVFKWVNFVVEVWKITEPCRLLIQRFMKKILHSFIRVSFTCSLQIAFVIELDTVVIPHACHPIVSGFVSLSLVVWYHFLMTFQVWLVFVDFTSVSWLEFVLGLIIRFCIVTYYKVF